MELEWKVGSSSESDSENDRSNSPSGAMKRLITAPPEKESSFSSTMRLLSAGAESEAELPCEDASPATTAAIGGIPRQLCACSWSAR